MLVYSELIDDLHYAIRVDDEFYMDVNEPCGTQNVIATESELLFDIVHVCKRP